MAASNRAGASASSATSNIIIPDFNIYQDQGIAHNPAIPELIDVTERRPFLHPSLNQLLLPVDHPEFDPFVHDPLLLPREQFAHLAGPTGSLYLHDDNSQENQENQDSENQYQEEEEEEEAESTQSDTEVAPSIGSATESNTTAVNPIQDFRILLPVNHPLFDPFVHDTLLWPRRDVVEAQWEEERQLNLAFRESLEQVESDVLEELVPQYAIQPESDPAGQSLREHTQSRENRPLVSVEDFLAGVLPKPAGPASQQWNNQDQARRREENVVLPQQQHFLESTEPFHHHFSANHIQDLYHESGNLQEHRHIVGVEEFIQNGYRLEPKEETPSANPPQTFVHFDQADNIHPHYPTSQYRQQQGNLFEEPLILDFLGEVRPHTRYRPARLTIADQIEFDIRMREAEWVMMKDKATIYEQEVNRLLELREAGDSALERELDERTIGLRNAVEDMIFEDIESCQNNEIPEKCWLTHHKIIIRYSKAILPLKKDNNRPVELRKMYAYFTKFIKLATKFYRALIQRLISHFGVTPLKFVAQEFKFEIDPSDKQKDFSSDIRNVAIFLCYENLLHLGDLSRYRENYGEPNPRNPDSKNWGPAKGYYALARKVLPTHPKAFNQLAVLAQYEQNHFTAIYYLYRSLLAEEPDEATHETTLGNLKICFAKILKEHTTLEVTASEEITSMFSRYHAHCFLSNDASEYESLKSDLLNQITLAVKERAVPAVILNRMILINIAAEHLALSRDRATLSSPKVVTFLRFNIETFTSILMVLQQELDGTSQDSRESVADLVSAVTRRMLPSLRLYSAWLLISHHILVNETNDMSLNVQVKQLWQTYATTLSLLLSTFPMGTLRPSQYLLEEDDDIGGFKPLMDISDSRRLGKEVARVQERDHPNQESLARILYLIEDGIELCTAGNVPIEVKNSTFAFQDGIISTDSNTGNAEYPTITLRDIPVNPSGVRATSTASRLGQANPMGSVISEPVSTTLTNKMNAMVDDLVGSSHSREDSDEEEDVILWKGRRAFYQSLQSNPKATSSNQAINNATITPKTPMVAQAFSQPNGGATSPTNSVTGFGPSLAKGKAPIPPNYMAPYAETVTDSVGGRPIYVGNRSSRQALQTQLEASAPLLTASDLVSYVQNYTSRMTISQQNHSNLAVGKPGSSGMSMSQPGPADPVTPKLSSASLERPKQTHTPPLDFTDPHTDSSSTPLNSLNGSHVHRIQRSQGNTEVDVNAYVRNQRQYASSYATNRESRSRQDTQHHYYY
ncbi:hypothetical protein ABW20_dc0100487 [Dactylellina cionopaga]|nr:hypothetical protein ABW20_dc0100487 [Dactylellina cionopaga]